MKNTTSTINVVVIGKKGSGKSQFITSAISRTIKDHKSLKTIRPHLVPLEFEGYSGQVEARVLDTNDGSWRSLVESGVNIIIFCVDCSLPTQTSLDHIKSVLTTSLCEVDSSVFVYLVLTKIDLATDQNNPDSASSSHHHHHHNTTFLRQDNPKLKKLTALFPSGNIQVDELSVLQDRNAAYRVLHNAVSQIIYPLSPLYDSTNKRFTNAYEHVLRRIFNIVDKDGDHLLSPQEMKGWLTRCFPPDNIETDFQSLEVMRRKFASKRPSMVSNNGDAWTYKGFCLIHELLLKKSKTRIRPWVELDAFGYDRNLMLRENFLLPHTAHPDQSLIESTASSSNNTHSGIVSELAPSGLQFLTDIFQRIAHTQPICSQQAYDRLWETAPEQLFDQSVFPQPDRIFLDDWIAQWQVQTTIDGYRDTVRFLGYLGALNHHQMVQHHARSDLTKRKTFVALLVGKSGSGTTSFRRAMAQHRHHQEMHAASSSSSKQTSPLIRSRDTLISGKYFSETQQTLILQETRADATNIFSTAFHADVVCFLYDPTNIRTFHAVAELEQQFHETHAHTPSVFIATKKDLLDLNSDIGKKQPSVVHLKESIEHIRRRGLIEPLLVSNIPTRVELSAFEQILNAIVAPRDYLPYGCKPTNYRRIFAGCFLATAAIATAYYYKSDWIHEQIQRLREKVEKVLDQDNQES